MATARLIDSLSEGVALKPHPERIRAEVDDFFRKYAGAEFTEPASVRVWTRVAYVLGITHPSALELPPEVREDVRLSFFDYLWNTPLADIIARLISSPLTPPTQDGLVDRLNRSNSDTAGSLKSFQQTYRDEICGGMAIAARLAVDIVEGLARERSVTVPARSQSEREKSERAYYSMLCHVVDRRKEAALAFPTLHLSALCHAAVRWDKKRRLTPNDIYDFHHAEAAIPYCNIFLTERPLHVLLQQRHISISSHYPCRIISSISEAAEWARRPDGPETGG